MSLVDYKKDMMRCVRCSTCKFIPLSSLFKSHRFSYGCPASTQKHFHSYSGSGKIITALSLLDKRVDYSPELLDIVYRCSLCGMCDVSCRMGTDLEVYEILHELRKKCVEDGYGPMPAHKPVIESLKNYDNVWMQPRNRRGMWAKNLKIKDLSKEKAEILYFAGCSYSYSAELRHVPQKTAELFQKAGIDFGILGSKELCCGSPVYMIGEQKLYEEYAKKNIEMINNLGVKKVIMSCAGCFGVFNSKYPLLEEEMNFEVVFAEDYLKQLVDEGKLKLKNKVPMHVTFHDPCHSGRLSETRTPSHGIETTYHGTLPVKDNGDKVLGFSGRYDAPRDLIKSIPGVKLVEMERIREYSWCCGSGGGAKSAFPDFALATANERIEEALATGAEAIVTNCPWCEKNLLDAINEGQADIKLFDTVELLYESAK